MSRLRVFLPTRCVETVGRRDAITAFQLRARFPTLLLGGYEALAGPLRAPRGVA